MTITNRQIVFILFLSSMAISFVRMPRIIADIAGASGWVYLLAYSIIFAVSLSMLVSVNLRYDGCTLYEYGKPLLGKALFYIVIGILLVYAFGRVVVMSKNISTAIKYAFLPKTPITAIIISMFITTAFIASKGTLSVGRIFEIYGMIELVFLLIIIIMMLFQGNSNHIMPLFDTELIGKGITKTLSVADHFNGPEVLLLLPLSQAVNGKRATKITFITVVGIAILYILLFETTIMMVGPNAVTHFEYPVFVAIRRINIDAFPMLSRIDIFFLTIGLSGFFCAMSVAKLLVVEVMCKLFPSVSRGKIVIVTTVAEFAAGFLITSNKVMEAVSDIFNIYGGILVCVLLPISLYIISRVKKNVQIQ